MKALKIVGIVLLGYVVIVVLFESLLGYFQPEDANTLIITTFDADGEGHDRVLTALDSDAKLYVAVNHWPRAWYRRSLANPQVRITRADETWQSVVVPVSDEEYTRLQAEHPVPIGVRFLMGFAPRRFVRLDPATD